MLESAELAAALANPLRVSDYSAWVPHIPFAFTLVELLRPRVFVELGTHKGDSYCAFCQAVKARGLQTQCHAVDTWTGDDNAGHYAADILQDLRRHHDPLYATFSSLKQSTFDAAAKTFAPACIDLLHIDGAHDEHYVRHDFDTWRPLLSDAAVVLFHDTQVQKEGFGVHRVWSDLCREFPHFEFLHGYGLGVLAVGRNPPPPLLRFLQRAAEDPGLTRTIFATLGHRIELSRGLGLLTRELQSQIATANRWRRTAGAPQLPAFEPAGTGEQALAPPASDAKAWLDRLAWFAANVSGDFAYFLAAQKAAAAAQKGP